MKVSLPYGKGRMEAELPDARVKAVLQSRLDEIRPDCGGAELIRRAMRNPIGCPPLEALARGKRNVVLIASDHTRPVPSKLIVPPMLEEIRKGAPEAEVTILIATGCHRGTTKAELVRKFGEKIVAEERIVIHDCEDEASLAPAGVLPSGGKLILNRLALEADLLVAEGFIEPHFFAGFSGGRKSVLPGVASRRTVHSNHCAAFIADEFSRAGELGRNPIHRDMIYAAKHARLQYIVNTVLNSKQEVVAAFAGDCDLAHRVGARFVAKACGSAPCPADIVLTSNNGYPLDQNVYQAVKGMSTARLTCKKGGVIVIAAECADGIGGEGFYRMLREAGDVEALRRKILAVPQAETSVDQWQVQVLANVLAHCHVVLISSVPDEQVRAMHLIPAHSIEEGIAAAEALLGTAGAEITVVPEGISTIIG